MYNHRDHVVDGTKHKYLDAMNPVLYKACLPFEIAHVLLVLSMIKYQSDLDRQTV